MTFIDVRVKINPVKQNPDPSSRITISITNDGNTIPIEFNKKEQLYIPELLFGHLMTGSNFNDDEVSSLSCPLKEL